MMSPHVVPFFDAATFTLTYVVIDTHSDHCAVIDPVLNLDYASGSIGTESADEVIAYIKAQGLTLALILETHIHADHLSSAPYLQEQLGGRIVIGSHITAVQDTFGTIFDEDEGFRRDGSQFDLMLSDGDTFHVGDLEGEALHVPGHTPACMPISWVMPSLLATRCLCPMRAPRAAISQAVMPAHCMHPVSDCCRFPMTYESLFVMTTSPKDER